MKRVPQACLLALVALSFSAAAQAAQDAGPSRAVRAEEGRQKGVTTLTGSTARELTGLIDEYQFNGMGDAGQLKTLDTLKEALARLASPEGAGEQSPTMPWVVSRLSAARELKNLAEVRQQLVAAGQGQDAIVKRLDELMKQVQSQFGTAAKSELQEIIKEQQKLKDTTEKLAEQTLGKEEKNLSEEQKADLEKTAQQQQAVEQQVEKAIEELKEQAKEAEKTDPEQAKAINEAVKELEQAKVEDQLQQAAENIADNKTAQAQEQQEKALEALEKAQEKLNQANEASQPETSLAELEQQAEQAADLVQAQQDLLDKTNALDQNSTQQDFNQLQQQQAEIQGQLAELQQELAQGEQSSQDQQQGEAAEQAEQAMEAAEKELGEMDQKPAAGEMAKALEAMKGLAQSLQQELAQKSGQPMPPKPGQGESQEKPELVVQDKSQTKDPKESDKLGADLKYGQKKDPSAAAGWQVGLAPKEREALSTAQKDRFPTRYEQQLTLYYQNLAAGDSSK